MKEHGSCVRYCQRVDIQRATAWRTHGNSKKSGYGGQLCASLGFQPKECRSRVEALWLGNRVVRLQNLHHALRQVLALLLHDLFARIFPILVNT
jgi:hypothetical protein